MVKRAKVVAMNGQNVAGVDNMYIPVDADAVRALSRYHRGQPLDACDHRALRQIAAWLMEDIEADAKRSWLVYE